MRPHDPRRPALIGLGAVLALRAGLAFWHFRHFHGYPFFLSSAELLRAVLSDEWARAPRLNVDAMWLPGAFWVYGGALRLWAEPRLFLPLLNTLFTLGALGFLFLLTEVLTGSAALALAAASYAAFQAQSLILGTGGSADPLLHLTVAAGLYCWARHLKGAPLRWMLVACALIAAGSLVRYEAWLFAVGIAVLWIRDRRRGTPWPRFLGPLLILALPVALWLLFQAAQGDALNFLRYAVDAHDEDFGRMPAAGRLLLGLADLPPNPALWLCRLLPGIALLAALLRRDADRLWRSLALLGLGVAAAFALTGVFVEINEDLHPWFVVYAVAPFVPWFVLRATARLGRARGGLALGAACALLLPGEVLAWKRLTHSSRAKASILRMAGAIKDCSVGETGARFLIQTFPSRAPGVPEHVLQQGLSLYLGRTRVLLDRACALDVPDSCSQQPRSPSVLELPPREAAARLAEERISVVAAGAADLPALPGYEAVPFGTAEALVARDRPGLLECLAARSD